MSPLHHTGRLLLKIISIVLLSCVLFLPATCVIVETASKPRRVRLKIAAANPREFKVLVHGGAGRFREKESEDKMHYDIAVPMMEGGYRRFLFIKYNVHDPLHYKIIKIKKGGQMVLELSLKDVDALPRNAKGYSELSFGTKN